MRSLVSPHKFEQRVLRCFFESGMKRVAALICTEMVKYGSEAI